MNRIFNRLLNVKNTVVEDACMGLVPFCWTRH